MLVMKLVSKMAWKVLETEAGVVVCLWLSAGCLWALWKVYFDLKDMSINWRDTFSEQQSLPVQINPFLSSFPPGGRMWLQCARMWKHLENTS